jgi:hypothetical protein
MAFVLTVFFKVLTSGGSIVTTPAPPLPRLTLQLILLVARRVCLRRGIAATHRADETREEGTLFEVCAAASGCVVVAISIVAISVLLQLHYDLKERVHTGCPIYRAAWFNPVDGIHDACTSVYSCIHIIRMAHVDLR